MPPAKSKLGRGGNRKNSSNRESSAASTQALTRTSSPPSVSRKSLPSHQPSSSTVRPQSEPSRRSPDPLPHRGSGGRSMSSQRQSNTSGGFQQPQLYTEPGEPPQDLNRLELPVHSEEDDGDQEVDTDEDGEDGGDDGEEVNHQEEDQLTLDDLLKTEGRDLFTTKLSPILGDGLWFDRDEGVLVSRIVKILQEKFDDAYYSWSVTPREAQDRYFVQFALRYNWDPVITHQVRDHFDEICGRRLKGIVSYAKSTGRRPNWIRKNIWSKMLAHWKTEDAIKKSKKASLARNSPRGGLGPHKHVGGPKSTAQHQREMSAEVGREVSIAEVFVKTHTRKDGTYVDEKARLIGEKFQQKVQATESELDVDLSVASDGASQAPKLTAHQMDAIFLETTTLDSRGIPYGLGRLSQAHKKRKHTLMLTCTPDITALEDRLKDTEAKLAEQVKKNQQVELLLRYFKQKDPSLCGWMVQQNPEDTTA